MPRGLYQNTLGSTREYLGLYDTVCLVLPLPSAADWLTLRTPSWVKKIGADECVDYKSPNFKKALAKATQEPADVYFDNVGGEILDTMLSRMALNGRVVVCGAISKYNKDLGDDEAATKISNWFLLIGLRLEIRGYGVYSYAAEFPKTQEKLIEAVEQGKLDVTEAEQVVEARFEDVPGIWLRIFKGENMGKLLTRLV